MRVLMVTREHPPYSWGGMSMVCQELERLLPERGIDLTIIAPSFKGDETYSYDRKKVRIIRVPIYGTTFLTRIPSFAFFASRKVSALQSEHDILYSHATPLFCKTTRPLVVHFHGTRFGEYYACRQVKKYFEALCNRAYVFFDRALVKKSDKVVVLTENMKREIELLGVKNKDITVIPNGVDTNFFRPTGTRLFNKKEKCILYVGRLDARKGLDTLIAAVEKVTRKLRARIVIAGEGRIRKELTRLATALNIRVDFKGKVTHKSLLRLYNEADIFVLPSVYEGFPLVMLEAIACGTPTITSSSCPHIGVPQFETSNSSALAELLLKTLSCRKKTLALSEKCLQISPNYTWRNIVGTIEELLAKTAAEKTGTSRRKKNGSP